MVPNEVISIIKSLKNKHSSGIDDISSSLVKGISVNIADILSHIFNASLELGIFPELLKTAIVLPLFKKGCKKDVNNYRPISLLNVFSKILEKAVKARLTKFLGKINFLGSQQFGFRSNLSTEDALNKFLGSVHKSLNNDKTVAAVFVDITKAFDTVNHQILLLKLSEIGIRGTALNWFKSYLKNRYQYVKLQDKLSEAGEITAGVPQGSVLGPLLFLVYLNSIFDQNFLAEIVAFADDMALVYVGNSVQDIEQDISQDLKNLRLWFDAHKMVLSTKTKMMFFHRTQQIDPNNHIIYHSANCNSNTCDSSCFLIENVKNFRYLGLNLDTKLNWKHHITITKNNVFNSIRQLYILRSFCTSELLRIIYFALIHSRLQYGLTCWGGAYLTNIRPLLLAQKYVLRVIYKKKKMTPSLPLFRRADILPLRSLFVYKTLKYFYGSGGNLNSRQNENYNLRNRYRCNTIRANTEHFRRSYLGISPIFYNKLPNEIKMITNRNKLFKEIKLWLSNIDNIEILFDTNS